LKKTAFSLLLVLSLVTLFVLGVDWVLETSGVARELFGLTAAEWPGLRNLREQWAVWALGAAAMCLPVLTAAVWVLAGRDDHIVASSPTGDVIRLAPAAIERVVDREIRSNVVDVVRVKSLATQGPGRTPRVRVNIAVSDRVDVPSVERATREEAVKALRTLLGMGEQEHVRVVVYDVKGAAGAPSKPRRERPAAAPRAKARKPAALADEKTPTPGDAPTPGDE
jgi:hypothetical protein